MDAVRNGVELEQGWLMGDPIGNVAFPTEESESAPQVDLQLETLEKSLV